MTTTIESLKQLRKQLEDANNTYDKLSNDYKINEYFPSKKYEFYEFCATQLDEYENYVEILLNILAITTNEFIDVIFIGRCSVGKSKIINAILMENLLPCAPSATTNCFVKISQSDDEENYIKHRDKEKTPLDFDNLISEIKNRIISDSCCEFNETIEIFLSQSKWNTKVTNGKQNKKIRLIDTPGYDNCKLSSNSNDNCKLSSNSNDNSSIEKSIIDRCKIANIIVLVVTHNLSDKEKEILMELDKISSELSIFVLVNKWDLSDNDSDQIRDESESKIRDSFLNKRNESLDNSTIKVDFKNIIYFISGVEQIQNNKEKERENKETVIDDLEISKSIDDNKNKQMLLQNDKDKQEREDFSEMYSGKVQKPEEIHFEENNNEMKNSEETNLNIDNQRSKENSSQNSDSFNKRQYSFSKFIEDLNKQIDERSFPETEPLIEEFYKETDKKYQKSVQDLKINCKYFTNIFTEIKNKLDSIKDENISKLKKNENINSENVDKLVEYLDSLEKNLQEILKDLFDDFINKKSPNNNKYLERIEQLKDLDKWNKKWAANKIKVLGNILSDWVAPKQLTEGTSQNDSLSEKFLQFINSYFSKITDQFDNVSKFFEDYCEFLKSL